MWKLGLLGLNHATAPVDVRERFTLPAEAAAAVVSGLLGEGGISGGVWLQTCNRSELYFAGEEPPEAILRERFAAAGGLTVEEASPHIYGRTGRDAVRHLFRVVSGLDSMIVGEPQIFGQVKAAYEAALRAGFTDPLLNELFQRSFATGKKVRTDTGIGEGAVSVSYAGVALARKVFDDLGAIEILFIGAGEMAELALLHLKENGVWRIKIANRTLAAAETLADRFNGRAYALDPLPELLPQADLVLACTASLEPLVTVPMVEEALRRRKHKPMVFIDMAVPADIERGVGRVEEAYLYTIDDLKDVVERNRAERARRMGRAEELVDAEADKFMDRWASLQVTPLIQEIQAHVAAIQRQELEKMIKRNPGFTPEQVQAVEYFSTALLNKLLHAPITQLKAIRPERHQQQLIRKFLGMEEK
jgi:glutamyl-tRNA reductase